MTANRTRVNVSVFLMLAAALMASIAASRRAFGADTLDLSGKWQCALDPKNEGITGNWFDQSFKDSIALPGILQSQGFGNEIEAKTPWVLSLYDHFWYEREDYKNYAKPGNVKVPFLSQPPRHYIGAAWYEREIEVPATWNGKRVELFMERPHWESTVWLDGGKLGSARSLVAPHEFDLGPLMSGKHRLAVRVDNSMILPYRLDAHSVSDSLGMSWNGIVGKIEMRATSPVWINDAQVFTGADLTSGSVNPTGREGASRFAKIAIQIGNATNESGTATITANGKDFPVAWTAAGGSVNLEVPFVNPRSWNEFHPNLQKLTLKLNGKNADDTREITFGFRDLKTDGKKLMLNGREIYLRGTHHGGDFPLTGYPPTDVAYWRKIFQINKDWGINHIRFHSFCPPEAAFQAADELGIYLQPEPGTWNEISPGTALEKMLYEETDAMIRAYGNHPSFLMLSPSNEPKGRWKESLDKWIEHYREADPRRLYNNGTGHTEKEVPGLADGTDFLTMQRIGPKMLRGNSAWFGLDYGKSLEGVNVPVLSHELGQWISYPDYDVIKKFTGYMRPGNYEIFRDSLAAHGLAAKNKDFAYASGRYQLECYKEEIEANLRTPGMSGYQLLDLHDYLGQGTALVGLLDTFWEEKGYVNAKEFRRFNGETVPLVRQKKNVFSIGDKFEVDAEIAHFGELPIENASAYWKITDSTGRLVVQGEFPQRNIPIGKNISLGKISLTLNSSGQKSGLIGPEFLTPAGYNLVVGLKYTGVENDWNFWVYPSSQKPAREQGSNNKVDGKSNIVITHDWTEAEATLNEGGKVLYMPRKSELDWTSPPLDTLPVFWNRLMNPAWSRMLGLWIDKKHPALAEFPTDSYFDWQWTEIVKNARAVNLDRLPKGLQPIVQPVDDWNRNYKLGLIFEAKVGHGKLLVSSADLENRLEERIVARQLRQSILDYMGSARFDPKTSLTPSNLRQIFFDTQIMKRLGAKAAASGDAANAIDGDPNTFWIAGDQKDTSRQNQEMSVAFPKAVAISGVVVMPRQNHREHEGDIREYSIMISDDGTNWREINRGVLKSTFEPQKIDFGEIVSSRYLKLVSLSGYGVDKTTAIADLAVIYAGPPLPENDSDLEYKRVKSASPDIDEGTNKDDKKPKRP